MAIINPLAGKYVTLKSATLDDAAYTLSIRQDPEFTKYLPEITGSLEDQIAWLKKQRETPDDYFFVVWDHNNKPLGTVGVFDIESDTPKSGRLALRGNALENIEAQYLAFRFAFSELSVSSLWGFIYAENHRAIRFAQVFGVTIYDPETDLQGRNIREVVFFKNDFFEKETEIRKMLYRGREK